MYSYWLTLATNYSHHCTFFNLVIMQRTLILAAYTSHQSTKNLIFLCYSLFCLGCFCTLILTLYSPSRFHVNPFIPPNLRAQVGHYILLLLLEISDFNNPTILFWLTRYELANIIPNQLFLFSNQLSFVLYLF